MTDIPVKIDLSNTSVGTIEIAGQDIADLVRGFRLDAVAGDQPSMVLEIHPRAVLGKFDARVDLDPQLQTLLGALGWTPPTQHVDTCNRSHHDVLSDTTVHCDQPAGHGGPHQAPTPDHARTAWNEPPIITDEEPMRA